jgi:hypothetical protein
LASWPVTIRLICSAIGDPPHPKSVTRASYQRQSA